MQKKMLMSLLIVSLFLLPALPMTQADTTTTFASGLPSITMLFPKNGGTNTTPVVDIPGHMNISSAKFDVEGIGLNTTSGQNMLDFSNPKGSTAWIGSLATIPPVSPPANLEATNKTADGGLKAQDGSTLSNSGVNGAAYQLFEFHLGNVELVNFTLYWKGMGTTQPKMGFSGSNVQLYIWNATASVWELYYSLARPSIIVASTYAYFNASAGNYTNYIDAKGNLCMMATTNYNLNIQASTMDTDYVSLSYYGKQLLFPADVKIDIGNDGTTEYQKSGDLKGKVTVEGAPIVAGFQQVINASTDSVVHIPIKFSSSEGGVLFISNLSINYVIMDLPPQVNKTIMDIQIDENTNATDRLDLWEYFNDDMGVANLTFSIPFQENTTRVEARLDADGHHVSFYTMTPYWFGKEDFRVRATDKKGQYTNSNTFSVIVKFVDNPPIIEKMGTLHAKEGLNFAVTFNVTDPDLPFDPTEKITLTITSDLQDINITANKVYFTPTNSQVGTHHLNVSAMDNFGKSDKLVVPLIVTNINNPPKLEPISDQTIMEHQNFTMNITATDPDLALGLDQLAFSTNSTLISLSAAGLLKFTPQEKDVGDHQILVVVTDTGGLKDSATFKIIVMDVNDPPIVQPISNMTVYEGSFVSFTVNATDPDAKDQVANFQDDSPLFKISSSGWINFTPLHKDVGVHYINVTANDKEGLGTKIAFKITVIEVNFPPTNVTIIQPLNGTKFKHGQKIAFQGFATDPDDNPLNYSWSVDGKQIGYGQTFSTKSIKSGKHMVKLTVSDGKLSTDSKEVAFTVKSAPPKGVIPGPDAVLMTIAVLGAALIIWKRRG
jgi:hypothetical protein